jgi:hypothetical protein
VADSEVAIANRALDALGASPITSLADDTAAAGACKRNLPIARDYVLRSYPWNCATRRASLPALVRGPAFGFAQAYQLPADCLRVIAMQDDVLYGQRWRIEGGQLLTDVGAPLLLRYIARVEDVSQWDAMLADVIAAKLAASIAFTITSSASLAAQMLQAYQQMHAEARRMDAREASQDEGTTADLWTNARFGGRMGGGSGNGPGGGSGISDWTWG